ncbi:hypothetical protein AMTRI_Chr13g90760 [Amborella trichopoda]|uniref:Dof zinc finger protein n=1 Tax=Amborella trichopoda TaxID=13333 RepID=U5CYX1_AMBTC|nr:dof zinc finger protein DOF5.7 [Amborella trichopoda]ERN14347.1 hypothetical protein AMTR_s00033p00212490 [Amborella trichopoda]|eukprot:XP_006852880.1 dof zinc finger protein DOF5.7 [Amborella trichopoda]
MQEEHRREMPDKNVSGTAGGNPILRPPEEVLRCPRCDSANTKFCYYNNYSLAQPRHFCKSCRRYWTKGGALRNVPIGGGCRKNKRSSSKSPAPPQQPVQKNLTLDQQSSTPIAPETLKFLHGLSPSTMDLYQIGLPLSLSHPFMPFAEQPSSLSPTPPSSLDLGAIPLNIMNSSSGSQVQEQGFFHGGLASSIESLSCLNADLHWRLQQQRWGHFLGGESESNQRDGGGAGSGGAMVMSSHGAPGQGVDSVKSDMCGFSVRKSGDMNTEWLFENAYTANASSNGLQTWQDLQLQQYSALP